MMAVFKDNLTIIIQGILHKNTIKCLENYPLYCKKIIVSYWNTDDDNLIKDLKKFENENVILIENEFHINPNAFNEGNIYYHTYTSLSASKLVDTEYTLKMRSDQWFENLTHILDVMVNNPNKFVCSDLHFRPDNVYKYHASNNSYGCKSDLFLKMMKISFKRTTEHTNALLAGAYMYYDCNLFTPELFQKHIINKRKNLQFFTRYPDTPVLNTIQIMTHGGVGVIPEQLTTTSFLLAINIIPIPENSIQIMKDNVEIFNIHKLGKHVNKFNDEYALRCKEVAEIYSMDEL